MDTKQKQKNKLTKILGATSLNDVIQINKWWEKPIEDSNNNDDELRWHKLEHNGVLFPPQYEPHHVKIKYKDEYIELTPEQEEVATFWAQLLESEISQKKIAQKNFLEDFKKVLPSTYAQCSLNDFDFTPIQEHLQKVREKNKNKTPEEKKIDKEKRQKLMDYYGWAIVDGSCEKLSNFLVEPPGIFRGRGEQPLTGKLKERIYPEDITINIGKDDPVPICTQPGHSWGEIVNNNEATWLAYYKAGKNTKYVFLAPNSKFKGMSDYKKYEKARQLSKMVDKIREDYNKKFEDPKTENRQLAVATYLIDRLALRVGNEKGEDEADTVGCCTLRVEHVTIEPDNYITFDFLAKDSMRYFKRIQIDDKAHTNLARFVKGKNPDDDLFDLINAQKLNDYLKNLMDGLSAKVFRTYNASFTLQQQLDKKDFNDDVNASINDKVAYYNEANKEVAKLCNHQKTVPKNYNVKSESMKKELKDHTDYLLELNEYLNTFSNKKKKNADNKVYEDSEIGKLKKVFPKDKSKVETIIKNLKDKISKMEHKLQDREDNKEIALGTSKLNYMDPRITVSWCKKYEVPIEKVFSKSIRAKFPWAMYIEPSYKF